MTKLSYANIFEVFTEDAVEAADLQFRAELILALRDYCEGQGWTNTEVAKILSVPQPRVSEFMNGKINLISTDKLIAYASKLGFRLHPSYKKPTKNKPATIAIDVQIEEMEPA